MTATVRALRLSPICPAWCHPDHHTCWRTEKPTSAHHTLPAHEGGPVDLQLLRVPGDDGPRVSLYGPDDPDGGWLLTVAEAAAVADQLRALVVAATGAAARVGYGPAGQHLVALSCGHNTVILTPGAAIHRLRALTPKGGAS